MCVGGGGEGKKGPARHVFPTCTLRMTKDRAKYFHVTSSWRSTLDRQSLYASENLSSSRRSKALSAGVATLGDAKGPARVPAP